MTLRDLKDKHAGETITICGTGPSLDALDLETLIGPRIVIHRAGFAVPISAGETYWMVLDDCWGMGTPGPWHETLESVKDGATGMHMVCRNPLGTGGAPVPAPVGPNITHFIGHRPMNEGSLEMTREQLVDNGVLWCWSGAAGPAIHLAWLMGASDILLVGCDGGDGHAMLVDEYYETNLIGGFAYKGAHWSMTQALEALEIKYRFLSEYERARV